MKKITNFRTILLLAAFCLIVTVLGVAFREKKRPIITEHEETALSEPDTSLKLNNVSYSTLDTDNFKLWDLDARTARTLEDGQKLILEDLHMTFYQRSGAHYQLKADQGELDMESRNIRVNGNVKAILPDNATIETVSAFYDNTSRIITTNDPLTITRSSLIMHGTGMVANLSTETVSILKNVRVIETK